MAIDITPAQVEEVISALKAIASAPRGYTLTGASDWPLLASIGLIVVGMIGYMWHDIKQALRNNQIDITTVKQQCCDFAEKEDNKIWAAMRDCQSDCCNKERK